MIKAHLQVLTGNLKTVFDKINLMLSSKYSKYDAAVDNNRSRTPHANKGPFYEQLLGQVSHYALGQLWDQKFRLSQSTPLPRCTGLFWKSMGLPCAHEMQ